MNPKVFLLGLLTLAPICCLSQPAPQRAPFLAGNVITVQGNVFTSSSQSNAALATASDGRSALVWESKRQERGTFGIYARLFDTAGQPLSHELHVNTHLPRAQWHPAAQFSSDDTLWVAWESYSQDGSGSGIVARAFDIHGNPLSQEVPVNQYRNGDQTEVVLASGSHSSVLAAWSSRDEASTAGLGIRARHLGINTQGEEVVVSSPEGAMDMRPSVTSTANGYLVVWTRNLLADSQSIVMGRLLDASGTPTADAFVVADQAGVDQIEVVVAANANGQLALAWLRSAEDGYEVMAQTLDAKAHPLIAPRVLATPQDGWKSGVSVAVAPNGDVAVAYNHDVAAIMREDEKPKAKRSVLCQRFTHAGLPLDATPLVLTDTGSMALPTAATRLAWSADSRLMGSFDGTGSAGDSSAANLALWIPSGLQAPVALDLGPAVAATETTDADMLAANPPIWDPNFIPRGRLLGVQASGADFGFEGVPGTGWTPPDPEMAVGPSDILVMTNGDITSLTKSGAVRWSDLIEGAAGLWGSLGTGGFVFDPECCWDPHSNRFLAMANERTSGRSYFLLAVSKDDSPDDENDWWKYRFDVTALAGDDIDSPNMSVGPNSILLTADFFGPDKYLIYLIDKASVLGGGTAATTSEVLSGTGQQSMGVPVVYDANNALYILQSTEFGSNSTVILHAIENPFTSYSRTTFTLSVPTYTYPSQPPQKGSSSRPFLFEPRFWSVALRNDSMWAVHHVNNLRARVRWYEINLNGWPNGGNPSLAQDGEIDLGSGIHTFFPSIHVDANDNVAVSFARSAANEYISMSRATRSVTDPVDTMRPAQVVRTSGAAHNSGRWGDYSATQAEPNIPGTFWGHHEFTDNGSWRTWVAQYIMRPDPFLLSVPSLNGGSNNTFSVSGATAGVRVRFAYSLVGTGIFEAPGIAAILSLDAPALAGSATADSNGNASMSRFIPGSFTGTTVWLQAVENEHASNWLQLTVL